VSEVLKLRLHRGPRLELFFLRDRKGYEAGLPVPDGERWVAVEVKPAKTVAADFFAALEALPGKLTLPPGVGSLWRAVVYGGDEERSRHGARIVPWSALASLLAA
jgi:hypothetical protein